MKKIIKAIAFEKAVIELLKKENPQIQEGFASKTFPEKLNK